MPSFFAYDFPLILPYSYRIHKPTLERGRVNLSSDLFTVLNLVVHFFDFIFPYTILNKPCDNNDFRFFSTFVYFNFNSVII